LLHRYIRMNPDKPAHVVTEYGIHMIEYAKPEYISRHTDAGIFFIYQDRGYDKLVDEYEFRKRELIINRKDPNFIRPARVYIKFLELEIKQYEDIIRAGRDEGSAMVEDTDDGEAGAAVTEEEYTKFERTDTHYTLEDPCDDHKFSLGVSYADPRSETLEKKSSREVLDSMMETGKFEPQ